MTEPDNVQRKLADLPTWSELVRLFPISMWTASTIALGWWARGHSTQEVIDHLVRLCAGS